MNDVVIKPIPDQLYTSNKVKPVPVIVDEENNNTLVLGKDYNMDYANNVNICTNAVAIISGRAGIAVPADECNYAGQKMKLFTIAATTAHSFVVESIPDQTYIGEFLTPPVVVKYDDQVLTEGTDYTLNYYNNLYVGTAKVVIKGKGIYSGTIYTSFNIVPHDISGFIIKILWDYPESLPQYHYTGYAIKPTLYTDTYGMRFVLGESYTVSYVNNVNVGVGEVIVTGIGDYQGTVYLKFKITPRLL